MGRRRPVQKGLGVGEVKGSDVPLNVPLPSKVPLKVEFVVLSILKEFGQYMCCKAVFVYLAPGVRLKSFRYASMPRSEERICQKSRSWVLFVVMAFAVDFPCGGVVNMGGSLMQQVSKVNLP